jgi:hypothetical protein
MIEIEEDIRVIVKGPDGFRDAIYLPKEARAALSDAEIAAQAQARVDAHVQRLKEAPKVAPLTVEQMAARVDELVAKKSAIDAELATVEPLKLEESYTRLGIEKPLAEAEPVKR